MKKLLIVTGAGLLLAAAGTASAAPAHGDRERHAQPHREHAQTQPRERERVEKQVREHQDAAKGQAARAEEQVRTREMREGEPAGRERSAEMQARQQERKEIQEEYRTAQRSGEGEKVKGKKPWWKFWESDEEPN